jgi:hypothetical protein
MVQEAVRLSGTDRYNRMPGISTLLLIDLHGHGQSVRKEAVTADSRYTFENIAL